ncbi:hypothetical protein BJV74DRAFT_889893 [Russula compacta]|nr:hypothetical protein BJV74DRAFT_889893 [Russula compacta]
MRAPGMVNLRDGPDKLDETARWSKDDRALCRRRWHESHRGRCSVSATTTHGESAGALAGIVSLGGLEARVVCIEVGVLPHYVSSGTAGLGLGRSTGRLWASAGSGVETFFREYRWVKDWQAQASAKATLKTGFELSTSQPLARSAALASRSTSCRLWTLLFRTLLHHFLCDPLLARNLLQQLIQDPAGEQKYAIDASIDEPLAEYLQIAREIEEDDKMGWVGPRPHKSWGSIASATKSVSELRAEHAFKAMLKRSFVLRTLNSVRSSFVFSQFVTMLDVIEAAILIPSALHLPTATCEGWTERVSSSTGHCTP